MREIRDLGDAVPWWPAKRRLTASPPLPTYHKPRYAALLGLRPEPP